MTRRAIKPLPYRASHGHSIFEDYYAWFTVCLFRDLWLVMRSLGDVLKCFAAHGIGGRGFCSHKNLGQLCDRLLLRRSTGAHHFDGFYEYDLILLLRLSYHWVELFHFLHRRKDIETIFDLRICQRLCRWIPTLKKCKERCWWWQSCKRGYWRFIITMRRPRVLQRALKCWDKLRPLSGRCYSSDKLARATRRTSLLSHLKALFDRRQYINVKWYKAHKPFVSSRTVSFLRCGGPSHVNWVATPNAVDQLMIAWRAVCTNVFFDW